MVLAVMTESYIRIALSIIVALVLLYILFRFRASRNPTDDSLDLLKERLDKGEITQADYDEARNRRGK